MTEDEAKAKWCPFAQQTTQGYGTYNRTIDGEASTPCRCIGSACMAWRVNPHGAEHGWCGLAGVPTP